MFIDTNNRLDGAQRAKEHDETKKEIKEISRYENKYTNLYNLNQKQSTWRFELSPWAFASNDNHTLDTENGQGAEAELNV